MTNSYTVPVVLFLVTSIKLVTEDFFQYNLHNFTFTWAFSQKNQRAGPWALNNYGFVLKFTKIDQREPF